MREDTTVIRPQEVKVTKEAIDLIPRQFAERNHVCPLALSEVRNGTRTLAVAVVDPNNVVLLDEIRQVTHCRVHPMRASEQDIRLGIDVHYVEDQYMDTPSDLLGEIGNLEAPTSTGLSKPNGEPGASSTVENMLQRAVNERSSDIHIEPHDKTVYVRFRVDGVLYDFMSYPPAQHAQIISRIKILSKLDIAEKRLPQDGRFDMKLGQKEFDVRVSIVPSTNGEKAVLRLLQKGALAMDFDALGIQGRNRELLEEMIRRPFGMTLVTGPTGSGKTTTLYAALDKIDCVGKNAITIEDPVEYQFPRITQIQVHPKIGLTFAAGLRSILRQDPDIIMVGEVRDLETLQIAMQSALTGHMVLTTLHCNDAAAGAARMVDMGAEPFLISSSVNVILSQRLVRRLCEHCKREATISDVIRQRLNLPHDQQVYYSAHGCSQCRNTGYSGRVGLYEVIAVNDALQAAIVRKASASEIRAILRENGVPGLADDGVLKARAGIVSLDEVMRAIFIDAPEVIIEAV
jgi:type IV pilus assembly protein PilB